MAWCVFREQVLPLYDNGRPTPVGSVEVFVRLTSQGDLVVTHFNRSPDSNKYQYKPVDKYVPEHESTTNCPERIKFNPKKTCRHKTSCRKSRPKATQGPDGNCATEMRRTTCVLTMMEKLKALHKEMKKSSQGHGGEIATDGDGHHGTPCIFDQNCPAASCPFRTGEAANAFVDHLINGTRPKDDNNPLEVDGIVDEDEIVDDADLFVVNVGRVDPCRVIAPVVYKDGCSQCFETDFSATLLPPPPVATKPKKSKNGKKNARKNAKTRAKSKTKTKKKTKA